MHIKYIGLLGFSFLSLSVLTVELQILEPKIGNERVKKVKSLPSQTYSKLNLITELTTSAKKGDVRAGFSLANIYYHGIDVNQDRKLAFYWYMQVAKAGYASAQLKVADGYYYGIGIGKNFKQALKWYKKAADNGHTAAQHRLTKLLTKQQAFASPKQANADFKPIDNNNSDNQQKASDIVKSLTKYARQNNTFAQYSLAMLYYKGKLVSKDKAKAFYWIQKSAQLGFWESKISLALMYYRGDGVAKNYNLAIKWARDAAKNDNSRANALYKYLLNNPF